MQLGILLIRVNRDPRICLKIRMADFDLLFVAMLLRSEVVS